MEEEDGGLVQQELNLILEAIERKKKVKQNKKTQQKKCSADKLCTINTSGGGGVIEGVE